MINWIITSMESIPTTGIVVSANWSCIGTQGNLSYSESGTCIFPSPGESYTPYSDLTQNQVLTWVWTDGGVIQADTENSVNQGLQALVNPVVVQNPLPWNN